MWSMVTSFAVTAAEQSAKEICTFLFRRFHTCFWSYLIIGSSIMLSEFSKMRVESTPAGPASSIQPLLTSSVNKKD